VLASKREAKMADYRYAEVPVVEKRLPLRDVRVGMFVVMPVATLERDRSIGVAMRGSRRVETAYRLKGVCSVVLDDGSEVLGSRDRLTDVLVPEPTESTDDE